MYNKQKEFSYNYAIDKLKQYLQDYGIIAVVSNRVKSPFSIFQKLCIKSIGVNDLTDIIGFRILVKDTDTCYRVFSIVRKLYKSVSYKYKDYIKEPKANGYQSLHLVILLGPSQQAVELQIRSLKMHYLAEQGSASHRIYKQSQKCYLINLDNLNALRQAYEGLDQSNLTESAFFSYLQIVNDFWNKVQPKVVHIKQEACGNLKIIMSNNLIITPKMPELNILLNNITNTKRHYEALSKDEIKDNESC